MLPGALGLAVLLSGGEGTTRSERDVAAGLPSVAAREPEVKAVLVNLLENSRGAIHEGGTIRMDAARDGVGLVLRDDGSGIPPELMPRVFEPRFSTRSTRTGLGLTIVRRLVESWGVTVAIESDPGQITVVTLGLRRWPRKGGGSPEEPPS
jgi:signal transduction histidine kinase